MVMVLDVTLGPVRSGHGHRSYPTAAKPISPDNISQTEGEILVRTCTVHAPELVIERKCQSRHGRFQMRLHIWLKHRISLAISSWHDDVGLGQSSPSIPTSTPAHIQNIARRLLLSWSMQVALTRFSHFCSTSSRCCRCPLCQTCILPVLRNDMTTTSQMRRTCQTCDPVH